jgi:hypothetical protein
MSEQQAAPRVYAAIAAITKDLARTGIAKNRNNTQGQGFKFRGIDDVYNALAPLLAEHGLCIIPRMTSREQIERSSKSGGALFFTTVHAEFDFVSVEDGSKHTACTIGEAQDSGDKSTNKAMSAAYKYVCFMTFCIPLEGTPDADESTVEVASAAELLPESQVVDYVAAISDAATSEELLEVFKAAYKAARAAEDVQAAQRFTKAKDARKAALAVPE